MVRESIRLFIVFWYLKTREFWLANRSARDYLSSFTVREFSEKGAICGACGPLTCPQH